MSSTIRKGFKILEYFAYSDRHRGISEAARDLDMEKSAVQRAIAALTQSGYLEKSREGGKYQMTLAAWELGSRVIERYPQRRITHSVLRHAAQHLGYTVFLARNCNPFVLYLDKVEGLEGRTHSSEPGQRLPIYRTAAGLAIMAWLEPDDLDISVTASVDRSGYNVTEGANLAALQPELAAIRSRGYATSEGGYTSGVTAIAAPIWSGDSRPFGSITVAADSKVLRPEHFAEIGSQVVNFAREATMSLGGQQMLYRNLKSG